MTNFGQRIEQTGPEPDQTAVPTAQEAMTAYRRIREHARTELVAVQEGQPAPNTELVREAEDVWQRWCVANEVDWPATSASAREQLARRLECS